MKKCMKMAINTSLILTSHSQLSSKCKRCTRRKSQIFHSSKWMFVVCSMMTELSMQLLTRGHSTQFSVETVQVQMLIKCSVKYIEFSHQLVCTSALVMVFQIKEWDTSRNQSSIGLFSNTKLPSQLFQLQLSLLKKIKTRRTSTMSMF